jgi:hypothetical protein
MAHQQPFLGPQLVGQQGNQREQSQQGWGGAGDGQVRPLTLGLQPQVVEALLQVAREPELRPAALDALWDALARPEE